MMKAVPAAVPVAEPIAYRVILAAGLICGVLDITAAFINSGLRGTGPVRVLQFVASGWLGTDSFNSGLASASLGLATHFLIATSASAVFYAVSRKLNFLTEHAVVSGIAYGVVVYLFMSRIVVPLSAAPKIRVSVVSVLTGVAIHMTCVGLAISLTVHRYSK
jgi:hypothetical protein